MGELAMIGLWLSPILALVVGIAYPAYQTFTVIKAYVTGSDDELWKKMLAYWIGFGVIATVEAYLGSILNWIPLYYELKAVVLAFLVFGGGTDRFIYDPLMEKGSFGSPVSKSREG